ncbi:MAG: MjaI family restriction endonuclease [Bacteroidota bacterium]
MLNFKRNVVRASESIRQCEPKTIEEWRNITFQKYVKKSTLVNPERYFRSR